MRTPPVDDESRVRRTARAVGWQVNLAASALTILGVIALSVTISLRSRHEQAEHLGSLGHGMHRPDGDWIIDRDQAVLLIIVLGAVGVLLTGLVGWLAARRAVVPIARALSLQRHFVADASHELRTPLTVLSSRVQILQRRLARGEPVDDVAARLRADAQSLTDVLDDLLISAEGAGWDGRPTRVAEVVGEAVRSLEPIAEQGNVALVFTVDGDPLVAIAPVSLRRAVIALVDNAIQHSPSNAEVTVAVSVSPDGMVELHVSDRGPGLRGVTAETVFERFAHTTETGHRRGFGLGLALVRDIADHCGGSISVESTSPDGTSFLLRIPRVSSVRVSDG